MNRPLKKLISCILVIFYLISSLAITSYADNVAFPYYNEPISSKAAIVMDANSSIVLYDHNSDQKLYPASLTKIMTAIISLILDMSCVLTVCVYMCVFSISSFHF